MAVVTTQNVIGPACINAMAAAGGGAQTLAVTNNGGSSVVLAFSFVCPETGNLAGTPRFGDVRFYVSAVSGSPTVTAALYTDDAGSPGTLIETGSTTASPSSAGWNTCGGFTSTANLTEGTMYWVILQCTAGTSATIRWLTGITYPGTPATSSGYASLSWGMTKKHSTDNMSTWGGTAVASVTGFRVSIADGTDTIYFGCPVENQGSGTGSTEILYTDAGNVQEFGSVFTMPNNAAFRVRSVVMAGRKVGSPSGGFRCRIYEGTSLVGDSVPIPASNVYTINNYHRFDFASPVTLLPGNTYRIVGSNSAADNSSNYFLMVKFQLADDANDRALMPLATIQSTKLSGSSWTEVNTEWVPFALWGDTDGAFAAPEFPAVGDVQTGSGAFGWNNEFTPTCDLPAEADVESGVQYGAGGTEFTGTLVGGGGGGVPCILGG